MDGSLWLSTPADVVSHFSSISSVFSADTQERVFGAVPGCGQGTAYQGRHSLFSRFVLRRSHAPNVSTFCLQDTGASISLVSKAQLSPDELRRIQVRPLPIQGIGKTSSSGFLVLDFHIPGFDKDGKPVHLVFQHEFWVVDHLPPGFILGVDWMSSLPISLHLGSHQATLPGGCWFPIRDIPLSRPPTPSPSQPALAETASPPASNTAPDGQDANWFAVYNKTAVKLGPMESKYIRVSFADAERSRDSKTDSPNIFIASEGWVTPGADVILLTPSAVTHLKQPFILVTNVGTVAAELHPKQPLCSARFLTHDEWTQSQRVTDEMKALVPNDTSRLAAFFADTRPLDVKDDEALFNPPAPELSNRATVLERFDVGKDASGAIDDRIVALLEEFLDCFLMDGEPGHVQTPQMEIHLKDGAKLRALPPRRASPEKRKIIDEILAQLLAWGIIQPSTSPVSHPVLLVIQNGKPRFCVDYRPLNLKTIDNKYPLQRIDDMLEALSGSSIFSTLDAVKGYHQMEMAPDSRYLTAFTCHRGLFKYTRVPFGLKNAPAFFQRFMDGLLGSLRWQSALVYLDDVVIFSSTVESHLASLRILLTAARAAGLRFDPKKCHFLLRSVKLLGRMVSADGVSILEDRAAAIRALLPPTNLAELRSHLGLFTWYQAHIPRFKQYYDKLNVHLKGINYKRDPNTNTVRFVDSQERGSSAKSIPVKLSPEELQAFEDLKSRLADAVRLAFPVWTSPFLLYLDSSQSMHAAAIHQQRVQLLGDVPADGNIDAMALPASSVDFLPPEFDTSDLLDRQKDDPLWRRIYSQLVANELLADYYLDDNGLLRRLGTQQLCLPSALADRAIETAHAAHFGYFRTFTAAKERWYHPRLSDLVYAYVKHCPDCNRFRVRPRTGSLVNVDYEAAAPFEEVSLDVVKMVPKGKDPRTGAKVDGLLVILDTFSKTVLLRCISFAASSEEIAEAFVDMVVRQGWKPKRIICDSDVKLVGENTTMRLLCDKLGAVVTPSPPYHQQANPVKRYIQTIVRMLSKFLFEERHERWPQAVPTVELLMNSTPSTVTGFSPYDLIYIHRPSSFDDPTLPISVASVSQRVAFSKERLLQARHRLRHARDVDIAAYAKRRKPLPTLKVGDLVMVRLKDRPIEGMHLSTKFTVPLDGPFRIKEVLSDHRIRLTIGDESHHDNIFSTEQIQPLPPDDDNGRPGLQPEEAGDAEWEAQYIVEERMSRGRKQYRIKWVGSNRISWMDEDQLIADGCQELLDDWRKFTAQNAWLHPTPTANSVIPLHDSASIALDKPIRKPKRIQKDGQVYQITEYPLAFSSVATPPKYRSKLGAELEAAGFLWAWTHFRHFLEGSQVVIITDHAPLGGFLTSSTKGDYSEVITTVRALVMPYIHLCTFIHRPGVEHINVDSLSRLPTSSHSPSTPDVRKIDDMDQSNDSRKSDAVRSLESLLTAKSMSL